MIHLTVEGGHSASCSIRWPANSMVDPYWNRKGL